MIKLSDIAREILSEENVKKLFGSLSNRVTTEEMHGVFGELKKKLAKKFSSFNNTTKLSSRQDHGDIDIDTYHQQLDTAVENCCTPAVIAFSIF